MGINVKGALFGIKHVGKAMTAAHTGAIVNISSIDGFRGANGLSVYVTSKWALRGLTKAAALELGPRGVRVNSVHPGGVDTTMGNPLGLKGAGEGGINGAGGVIASAIDDALGTSGAVTRLPVTPQRMRELLRANGL